LYTPCVLGLRPSSLFNEFLLIKKKHVTYFLASPAKL
jgi:hypothetical protein